MLGLNNLFNSLTGHGINKRDRNGETQLFRAVKNGDIRTVKKLLRDGANPNAENNHKLTPLQHAAYWGEGAIVEALLRAGADVHHDNGHGWTALHSAAVSGGMKSRKDVIEQLKKAGAKDDVKDKHGWTPKDYMSLWEENAAAAEKLKQFLSIPVGLAAPRPRTVTPPPAGPKI